MALCFLSGAALLTMWKMKLEVGGRRGRELGLHFHSGVVLSKG